MILNDVYGLEGQYRIGSVLFLSQTQHLYPFEDKPNKGLFLSSVSYTQKWSAQRDTDLVVLKLLWELLTWRIQILKTLILFSAGKQHSPLNDFSSPCNTQSVTLWWSDNTRRVWRWKYIFKYSSYISLDFVSIHYLYLFFFLGSGI